MRSGLIRALAVGCLAVGGLAACGGKNTVEPPAELVAFDAKVEVRQIWKRKVGRGSERLRLGLAPASDGTRVFAGAHDGTVAAISLADGEELWSTDTDLPLAAGPGVGGGLIAFGTSDGDLVVLDAESGEVRWQRQVGSEVIAPPAVNADLVVFRSSDGRLNAVGADNGRDRWTVVQSMPVLTLRGTSAPLMVGELVIAGFDNGRIGAYELGDGLIRWDRALATPTGRSEIERLIDVGVDIEVFGSDVYAATYQGRAAALDLASGFPLWEQDLSSFTGIGVDAQSVYVTDDVSTVIAMNRLSGIPVWRQDALRLRDVTAATRFRETVVVADFEGYVHWLSAADGSFMARAQPASAQISAKPLAIGPTLLVQSEDGTVAAFEIVDAAG